MTPLERLAALEHPDPHAILGAHAEGEGIVVRVLRPDAAAVELLLDGKPPAAMERVHRIGIFERKLPKRAAVSAYKLRVLRGDGSRLDEEDPYRFWPTLGDLDLHLFAEGTHDRLHDKLGAHPMVHQGVAGTAFAVWAPNARGVSVVGDFNGWDGRIHPMRMMGTSGVWELFVPGAAEGALYKFEIRGRQGPPFLKADPMARATERPPATASKIHIPHHVFADGEWMEARAQRKPASSPVSIYEVHPGSWRWGLNGFAALAGPLADHVCDLGFTHVELLPVMEHPLPLSWGYQVTGYFAPASRWGSPDELRAFIDTMHRRGIGVILDWVPAHFPKDDWALGRFDGTPLYEHQDPREGEHPDWGTYVFNYGRHETANFLIANGLFWLSEYHADGLRLDAVASMLYRDYSRREGEWIPNQYGGRENLEAIALLRRLNELAHAKHPGVMMIAEESTAWPAVSRPTYLGGLGFGFKWNMGWMHDTLGYFAKDPVYRHHHHNNLTFGLLYAWSENFILPLSHDEVVHGKGALLSKMPGDAAAKTANLRALYGYMWAHPGKKLLFMGGEIGQWSEWRHDAGLDWGLLAHRPHKGVRDLVRDLNKIYKAEPALWELDGEPSGFEWIDANAGEANVISFVRRASSGARPVVCVANFSGSRHAPFRVGLPAPGRWREILNTDAEAYGGGNVGNLGALTAQPISCHGRPWSVEMTLPPLSVVWLVPEQT